MKILVTGAMGFIGSNTVIRLIKEGHEVVGVDSFENPSLIPTVRMERALPPGQLLEMHFRSFKADIRDEEALNNVIHTVGKVDAIIHLAAVGSVPRSFANTPHTVGTNELGFSRVFHLAKTFQIPKLIFASSSSVYGTNNEVYKVEGRAGMPLSPYALSKKMNEELACILGPPSRVQFTGLRFFNVYGPGQRSDSVYSAVIPKFICDERPQVNGDGEVTRDFTYVEDVAEAIVCALNRNGPSDIVNVCTGVGTSLNHILDVLGKREVAYYGQPRPGDIPYSVGSIERAKNILGFEAKHTLKAGLDKTVKFYSEMGLAKSAIVKGVAFGIR